MGCGLVGCGVWAAGAVGCGVVGWGWGGGWGMGRFVALAVFGHLPQARRGRDFARAQPTSTRGCRSSCARAAGCLFPIPRGKNGQEMPTPLVLASHLGNIPHFNCIPLRINDEFFPIWIALSSHLEQLSPPRISEYGQERRRSRRFLYILKEYINIRRVKPSQPASQRRVLRAEGAEIIRACTFFLGVADVFRLLCGLLHVLHQSRCHV